MGSDQLRLWPAEHEDGLRWSVTRHKRLQACARRYYYVHYGSRGGHLPDAPSDRRQAFVLKALRNRHAWVGEVVHALIEWALGRWRQGQDVSSETLVEKGTQRMRAEYSESMTKSYRLRPMQVVGLTEHEYEEEVPRAEWQQQRNKMERCVRNFLSLPLVDQVRGVPGWRWLAVEELGSFEFEGAKIVVRPDFAWRREDDKVAVIDWKTGIARPEEEDLQLAVYGMFAQRSWGLRADHLLTNVVYLDTKQLREQRIETEGLQIAEAEIQKSLDRMRALAPDPDQPLDIERFAKTEQREQCKLCNFRRLCDRG